MMAGSAAPCRLVELAYAGLGCKIDDMTASIRRRVCLAVTLCMTLSSFGCKETRRWVGTHAELTEDEAEAEPRIRRGGMDVTFLVTADTHFGVGVQDDDPASKRSVQDTQGIEKHLLREVRSMNAIEGKAFPARVGTSVGKPLGVLVAGDLTDMGHPAEWSRFVAYFGRDGTDGLLKYPVFETWGNHDKNHGWYVRREIEKRHGHVRYTIDWQDLHLVCLGEAPDDADLQWLKADLERVGRDVGVVLYMHYPLKGPFSENNWFGNGDYRDRLADTIEGYRVLGIFHGHYHISTRYKWRGLDVYNVGSPKHGYCSYAVVRVTDDRMVVGSWDYRDERWKWVHDKAVFKKNASR